MWKKRSQVGVQAQIIRVFRQQVCGQLAPAGSGPDGLKRPDLPSLRVMESVAPLMPQHDGITRPRIQV